MANVKCPICNKVNEGLNLEETDGQFECIHCRSIIRLENTMYSPSKIPLLNWDDLPKMMQVQGNKKLSLSVQYSKTIVRSKKFG